MSDAITSLSLSRRCLLTLAGGLCMHLGAGRLGAAQARTPAQTPASGSGMAPEEDPFPARLAALGASLLAALTAFSAMLRRLDPAQVPALRAHLQPLAAQLRAALQRFRAGTQPPELSAMADRLTRAAAETDRALQHFATGNSFREALPHLFSAMHEHAQAQALLYPLRTELPPVDAFFLEPAVRARAAEFNPTPRAGVSTGIITVPATPGAHGGFTLYVPERYDPSRRWPLVVALHGAGGDGKDFLWTWLVEARSRGFLLLAPTSIGDTWSMTGGEDVDAAALHAAVDYVRQRWQVDPAHILLTGFSDGATYALLCGLRADMPFTALAPISGVLLPANEANGNLRRATGKRIYLVHGARDWIFPIEVAHDADRRLRAAGADLTFREIADLSHAYPREENARILEWFDPTLAL